MGWLVLFILFLLFVLVFIWSLIRIGAESDEKIINAINNQFYFSGPDNPTGNDFQPHIDTEILEEIACPHCGHINIVLKNSCSRCEVCYHKIGACDD